MCCASWFLTTSGRAVKLRTTENPDLGLSANPQPRGFNPVWARMTQRWPTNWKRQGGLWGKLSVDDSGQPRLWPPYVQVSRPVLQLKFAPGSARSPYKPRPENAIAFGFSEDFMHPSRLRRCIYYPRAHALGSAWAINLINLLEFPSLKQAHVPHQKWL